MIRLEKTLLLFWFILNLGIGALTVHEYGMSVDEPNNIQYAAATLRAYPSLFGTLYEPPYNPTFDGHGPAFMTIAAIPIKIIEGLFPDVYTLDLWHYTYFIAFQLTCLCLYWLAKRWFNTWTAWGIVVLFSTQPLLLGHAFINPKDIPFMFLFTLSIVLGFRMVDGLKTGEFLISLERPLRNLDQKFQAVDPRRKRTFLLYVTLILGTALSLFLFSRQLNNLIEQIITFLYTAKPDSWAGRIFDSLASHSSSVSAEDYVTKALRLFRRLKRFILIASALLCLAYFCLLIGNVRLSDFLGKVWRERLKGRESSASLAKSLRNSFHLSWLKTWLTEVFGAVLNSRLILAGVALGLATGVRAIGLWAGVIVWLYLLANVRSKAWTTAIAYFLVAGLMTYLAWPRLWGAPIQRYLEGLGILANFSNYPGRVLFNGQLYGATELPRSYLPVLLNIQFTEPLLLGVYLGLGILSWQLLRSRVRADLLLYIGLGFALPLFGLILLGSPLYHNFRQVLFLIPAMFMLAAPALELVFRKLTASWARAFLIVVLALPGIYSSLKLYPYEYVYYNSLVGGPAGVSNRYELDYWRISLREAALKLNEFAPNGATIIVTRSAGLFARYARPDLVIDKIINSTVDLNEGYDYLVQVARWKAWDMYPDVENVISIEREGVVLATVKDVKNAGLK